MFFLSRFSRPRVILMTAVFLALIPCSFSQNKSNLCRGKLITPDMTWYRTHSVEDTIYHDVDSLVLPESFDSRNKWPECDSINTILWQKECDGCWAFASTSVMSDRLCIATYGRYNSILSVQDLLECCTECLGPNPKEKDKGGCNGGDPLKAFNFWEYQGLVTGFTEYPVNYSIDASRTMKVKNKGCKPQFEPFRKGKSSKICRETCPNPGYRIPYKKDKKFSIKTFYGKPTNLQHIQAEIMFNGPVVGVFNLDDSMEVVPPGGILIDDKTPKKSRLHAVKLIGWDVIDGVPVWIMANSMSSSWCDNGFCHIRRGKNDFNIERYGVVGGIAKKVIPINIPSNKLKGKSGSEKLVFGAILKYVFLAYVII